MTSLGTNELVPSGERFIDIRGRGMVYRKRQDTRRLATDDIHLKQYHFYMDRV